MLKQFFRRVRGPRGDYYDYSLLAAVIILISFGLVMLYSASAYEAAASSRLNYNDMYYFQHQALIDLGAVIFAVLLSRWFDYHIFVKLSGWIYGAALVLMLMVKFSPLGVSAGGARRWLNLGVQFQPSEIAKIAVILFSTRMIIKIGNNITKRLAVVLLLATGFVQGLAAFGLTDNLSTGVIIVLISFFMVMIASPNTKPYVVMIAVAAALVIIGLILLNHYFSVSSNFRLRRILVWLNPEKYLSSGGYQVMQALYAIGSGGFFGKGLGNSTQKLSTIPEAQNDMIFAIICEELGLFGAVLVLLLFAYLLYRLLFIVHNAPDKCGKMIVSGVFVHISAQVILNICVVLNVIPTTGVTLPFVSFGGTSVLFLMFEIGLCLGVSRQIQFEMLPVRNPDDPDRGAVSYFPERRTGAENVKRAASRGKAGSTGRNRTRIGPAKSRGRR
jgi:cell division protein FtsW